MYKYNYPWCVHARSRNLNIYTYHFCCMCNNKVKCV